MPSPPLAPRSVALVAHRPGAVVPHASTLVVRWSAPPADSQASAGGGGGAKDKRGDRSRAAASTARSGPPGCPARLAVDRYVVLLAPKVKLHEQRVSGGAAQQVQMQPMSNSARQSRTAPTPAQTKTNYEHYSALSSSRVTIREYPRSGHRRIVTIDSDAPLPPPSSAAPPAQEVTASTSTSNATSAFLAQASNTGTGPVSPKTSCSSSSSLSLSSSSLSSTSFARDAKPAFDEVWSGADCECSLALSALLPGTRYVLRIVSESAPYVHRGLAAARTFRSAEPQPAATTSSASSANEIEFVTGPAVPARAVRCAACHRRAPRRSHSRGRGPSRTAFRRSSCPAKWPPRAAVRLRLPPPPPPPKRSRPLVRRWPRRRHRRRGPPARVATAMHSQRTITTHTSPVCWRPSARAPPPPRVLQQDSSSSSRRCTRRSRHRSICLSPRSATRCACAVRRVRSGGAASGTRSAAPARATSSKACSPDRNTRCA